MLRERLMMGIPLAIVLLVLVGGDGYFSEMTDPSLTIAGFNAGPWLCNGLISTVVVLILTLLTAHELLGFAKLLGYKPFPKLTHFFCAGLIVGPYVAVNLHRQVPGDYEGWNILWIATALALAFFLQAKKHKTEHAMENLASTMFIILYAGVLASFMIKLRMEKGGQEGIALLLLSIFVVKMTDTGAFFTGRTFGKHKMIPWLSAKKTWEGFVGGIVIATTCAVVAGLLLAHADIIHLPQNRVPGWAFLVGFGLVMSMISVAGDLCASLLKRDASVKDSSSTLPGLGGVLDVLDSPLLAAPFAWFIWMRVMPMLGVFDPL